MCVWTTIVLSLAHCKSTTKSVSEEERQQVLNVLWFRYLVWLSGLSVFPVFAKFSVHLNIMVLSISSPSCPHLPYLLFSPDLCHVFRVFSCVSRFILKSWSPCAFCIVFYFPYKNDLHLSIVEFSSELYWLVYYNGLQHVISVVMSHMSRWFTLKTNRILMPYVLTAWLIWLFFPMLSHVSVLAICTKSLCTFAL